MFGLLGIALALLAIIGGNYLGGGQLSELYNPTAAMIVVGGTLAASVIQAPREDFKRAWRLFGWAYTASNPDFQDGMKSIRGWCLLVRRRGMIVLEGEARKESDAFVANGLQLLADGRSPEIIRSVLEVELIANEQRDLQAVRVIESLGGYAPTLGIIGTVLGLIQVMANLAEPETLGHGIATAFVSTIYGVGVANLLLIPTANKIKRLVQGRAQYHEMLMDGLVYIAEGQSPEVIRQRLQGYLGADDAASKTA
ncbi:Flagellar motor rotation protein MotA [Marinobacterium lacunae]|uniref:Flagellar motor rotation protein MotA n=1 Tax=Marinobacterium lacunae TaxID=1232683 RepID=A0A081G0H6_9GAMM|nr:flagellar motor protein [Marinobacterium lacunae]KEA64281.1 Flagellar motor rotation protein MotA [Marinobacterium lacunae]